MTDIKLPIINYAVQNVQLGGGKHKIPFFHWKQGMGHKPMQVFQSG